MSDNTEAVHILLSRIASVLGVTVDHFYGEEPPESVALGQCLELLHQIRGQEGRMQALDCLTRIVREEQASDASEF